ncbi:hypothetical protein [Halorarum halobium]|uniref:hypothetical protein n=1 Tax=Halorarum halobium TaxID=3075121 RepID=UPI0028A64680|nr:hypothetical protein [Halobaculum sp. XH14]
MTSLKSLARSTARSVTDGDDGAASDAERRLHAAVVGLSGGALATGVMSAFRLPVARSPPPTAWLLARVRGGDPSDHVGVGLLLHLLYGTVAGGVFGVLTDPFLSGAEATRERRATALGAAYGALLSAFGVAVLLDRLLGLDLDPDERFVFHVSHLVYGLTLGTWVGSNE